MLQENSSGEVHPEGLTSKQEGLAISLFEIGAIKFGAFRLKLHERIPDAPLSPYYVDLRVLPLYPQVMQAVARVYAELAQDTDFDVCLGIPETGNPSNLSEKRRKNGTRNYWKLYDPD